MNAQHMPATALDVLAAWCSEKNIGKAEYERRSSEYAKCAAHDALAAALKPFAALLPWASLNNGEDAELTVEMLKAASEALAAAGETP